MDILIALSLICNIIQMIELPDVRKPPARLPPINTETTNVHEETQANLATNTIVAVEGAPA